AGGAHHPAEGEPAGVGVLGGRDPGARPLAGLAFLAVGGDSRKGVRVHRGPEVVRVLARVVAVVQEHQAIALVPAGVVLVIAPLVAADPFRGGVHDGGPLARVVHDAFLVEGVRRAHRCGRRADRIVFLYLEAAGGRGEVLPVRGYVLVLGPLQPALDQGSVPGGVLGGGCFGQDQHGGGDRETGVVVLG